MKRNLAVVIGVALALAGSLGACGREPAAPDGIDAGPSATVIAASTARGQAARRAMMMRRHSTTPSHTPPADGEPDGTVSIAVALRAANGVNP